VSSNLNFRISKGLVSSGTSSPLNGSYYVAGGVETDIDQVLSAGSNQLISVSYGPAGNSSGNLQAIAIYASQNCTIVTNGSGSADVQTLSITGTPTGGTFVLGFKGAITAPIAFNASAATVQTALQALATIGSGNVTCSGGALPGTPVVCTFAGTLATGLQPLIVAGEGGFTGGSSPTATVTHTTLGTPQDTIIVTAAIPILWDISSIEACPFSAAVSAWYVTNATATRLQARILTL
jgi:hypothetical protein